MADLAHLGLAVDSSEVERGSIALDRLTGSAQRAEAAAEGFSGSARQAAAASVSSARAALQDATAKLSAARASDTASKADVQAAAAAQRTARAALDAARAEQARVSATAASSAATQRAVANSARAAAAYQQEAAAAHRAADAARAHAVAVNDNVRRMGGSMSGLAAQFQDIGVTAAMDMNPLIIGLQQGTQIAGQMEVAMQGGASAAGVLATAVKSLLSPVTFVSIALTVLVAAAIQLVDWAKLGQAALRSLADVLQTVAPYATMAAAGLALLYAPAILGGIKAVTLGILGMAKAAGVAALAFAAANPALAFVLGLTAAVTAANIFRDDIERVFGVDVIGVVKRAANFVINSFFAAYEDIKFVWNNFGDMMGAAVIGGVNIAIRAIDGLIQKATQGIDRILEYINPVLEAARLEGISPIGGSFKLEELDNPYSDRLRRANADHAANIAGIMSRDTLGDFGGAIARDASAAADKIREIANGLGEVDEKAAKAAEKLKEAYKQIVDGANDFIASQKIEQAALGLTEQEANRLRHTYDLLNQARQAGITLTEKQKADLYALADAMAAEEAALRRLTLLHDLQFERDQIGRSVIDATIASRLRAAGQPVDLNSELAGYIRANELLKEQVKTWEDVRSTGMDAIDALVESASRGFKDIGDVAKGIWRDIAKQMLTLGAANPLKNALFGTSLPTMASLGGEGNFLATLLGMTANPAANASKIPGLGEAVSSMNVTAAVVNLSGGLPGLGDLSRLLPAANDNSAVGALTKLANGGGGGSMSLWKQAISAIESGSFAGNYSALGPITKNGDRAYGRYQVMGANIPSWTMGALGQRLSPQQFLGSPSAQDAVFEKYFGASVAKYGSAQQAASVWFTGRPINSASAAAADITGTTGSKYVDMFNAHLRKLGAASDQATKGIQSLGQGAGGLGNAFTQAAQSGGGGGGLLGTLFGGLSSAFSGTAAFSWLSANPGGYIGLYANGGVADRPSIFAEAGPEAAVPLPDGRRIPVDLRMRAAPSGGGSTPQWMHVTLGWDQGANGNIAPIIKSVAQQEATPIAQQTAGGMLSSYSYGQKNGGVMQDQKHYQRLKRRQ